MLYFAYGSNLDQAQMRKRCPGAEPVTCAALPDHVLAFGGFSRTWDGAVASIVAAPGARVQGLLYRIDEDELQVLDRHEGHPHRYQRVVKLVLDQRDCGHRAAMYLLPAERFAPGAPPPAYVDVLRKAYQRLGFDVADLERAARI